jgi:hypothetical protein
MHMGCVTQGLCIAPFRTWHCGKYTGLEVTSCEYVDAHKLINPAICQLVGIVYKVLCLILITHCRGFVTEA